MAELSMSTRSPALSGPTPAGVPVKMISPGLNVHHPLSVWIKLLIGNNMSRVLPSCRSSPLTEQVNDKFSRSMESGS